MPSSSHSDRVSETDYSSKHGVCEISCTDPTTIIDSAQLMRAKCFRGDNGQGEERESRSFGEILRNCVGSSTAGDHMSHNNSPAIDIFDASLDAKSLYPASERVTPLHKAVWSAADESESPQSHNGASSSICELLSASLTSRKDGSPHRFIQSTVLAVNQESLSNGSISRKDSLTPSTATPGPLSASTAKHDDAYYRDVFNHNPAAQIELAVPIVKTKSKRQELAQFATAELSAPESQFSLGGGLPPHISSPRTTQAYSRMDKEEGNNKVSFPTAKGWADVTHHVDDIELDILEQELYGLESSEITSEMALEEKSAKPASVPLQSDARTIRPRYYIPPDTVSLTASIEEFLCPLDYLALPTQRQNGRARFIKESQEPTGQLFFSRKPIRATLPQSNCGGQAHMPTAIYGDPLEEFENDDINMSLYNAVQSWAT